MSQFPFPVTSLPLSPQAQLLSRIQNLTSRLSSNTLSITSLIACNRALDNVDSVLESEQSYDLFSSPPSLPPTLPFGIERLERSALTSEQSSLLSSLIQNSQSNDPKLSSDAKIALSYWNLSDAADASKRKLQMMFGGGINLGGLVDGFRNVVEQMRCRAEENRDTQALAAAATGEVRELRRQVKELNNMSSQSASEVRYLAMRMQALETKTRDLAECLSTDTISDNEKAEAIVKWDEGITAWWGDCAEVESRMYERVEGGSEMAADHEDGVEVEMTSFSSEGKADDMTNVGSDFVSEATESTSGWVDVHDSPDPQDEETGSEGVEW